jgi:choline-sulfatase
MKKIYNKVLIILVLIIIIVGGFYSYNNNKNSFFRILKKEGIELNLSKEFIIEKDDFKENDFKERNILAKNNNEIIKIKIIYNIGDEKSQDYMADQKIILKSLYDPVMPPYPEFIGQEVSCNEKYKPILKEHVLGEYYLLYAGDRFGYGVCEEGMIKYKALLGYFYFENKLIKIEYFSSNKSFNEIENIINKSQISSGKKTSIENKNTLVVDNKENKNNKKLTIDNNIDLSCPDCNLMIISLTGLRKDHLGIYGYNRDTSPNIDNFFKNAIIFNEVFAPSPWTLPNAVSFFTSLFPYSHKTMKRNVDILSGEELTLAEVLESAGYKTAAFTGGEEYDSKYNIWQGFDEYVDINKYLDNEIESVPGKFDIGLKELNSSSLRWLKNNAGKKKFFLFLQGYDVHCPYTPDYQFAKKFSTKYDGDIDFSNCLWSFDKIETIVKDGKKYWPFNVLHGDSNEDSLILNDADIEQMIALYDAEIFQMDFYLKELFDEIKKYELLNNTIIIFMSEHGEYLGEHDRFMRAGYQLETFYDEGLRFPLLVHHPKIKEMISVDSLVQTVDIMPSLLDMLKIEDIKKKQRQGSSFLPSILTGEDINDFVYSGSDFYNNINNMGSSTIQVIRDKEWKFILEKYKENEDTNFKENKYLFNIKRDLGELDNVYNLELDVAKNLEKKLNNWINWVKR